MKVLIIEDDRKTASFVEKGMKEAGMVVDVCHDGHEGLDQALVHDYDVAVIDVMLPGLDGLSVVEAMRAEEVSTLVLILSAKRSVSDRIEGLKKGGDDYMVKPFSLSELLARVEALVRRRLRVEGEARNPGSTILRFEGVELDPWKREVRRDGQVMSLHTREFTLLEYLMRNAGRVVSKTSILEHVYDYSFDPQTNVVDVLVCRLRNKLDKKFERKLLHTVRGVGYVLKAG
ncbi:MAG: response regulator transcription factor [Akkermansiaceae bacterium]|nr:response regulator transcription factor [Akkermansiaceae bacterium]